MKRKDLTIQAVDDMVPQIARVGPWRFPQDMKERRRDSLSALYVWLCKRPMQLSTSLFVDYLC